MEEGLSVLLGVISPFLDQGPHRVGLNAHMSYKWVISLQVQNDVVNHN